jgi:hypothetical protein
MSSTRNMRKSVLCMAMGLCLSSLAAGPVLAQSATGSVTGQATAGAQVTITNPDTGFSRTVTAAADGSYRIPFVPVGTYTVQAGGGEPRRAQVALGTATTVNFGGATDLSAVQVIGSSIITPIDVSSTESATNITAQELARVPVERNVTSVALLAPGVAQGTAGFGGISFGGSSVAENAFYINGLNVTDFYNRIGFSEAPFDFYQEFQVKTGGYSVEFGRTTGGVVNAVAKSGSNEFHYGGKFVWGPRNWESEARNSYLDGDRYITRTEDSTDSKRLNVWASGPIVKDKLFFFAMYEGRDIRPQSTDDEGSTFNDGKSNDGFWGTTLDWHLTDDNLLSLMAFSNKSRTDTGVYDYDYDARERGDKISDVYDESGGRNWALSWTSYLTDNFSMKLMVGRNQRHGVTGSPADAECNYVTKAGGVVDPGVPIGCNANATIYDRDDIRKQQRADFEWTLGDHLLRFGLDREQNTSDLSQLYSGPGGVQYNVYTTTPGTVISSSGGGRVPDGYYAYVRARKYAIVGNFETTNQAMYLEDNWSVTDNFVLNLGLRSEGFDNKDQLGRSYIKMDNMVSPRVGFSWDMKGDGTTKLFGNAGRYFLPVANVINIKQGGALLDDRTYYGFDGWEIKEYNGVQYAVPKLGPQFGHYDGQGNGQLGDLRSEVDADMDQVYQDELILGFQQQLSAAWSWGVRGIYRKLHNAIDDMEISATAQCGEDGYIGWVMANPGSKVTVWGDTDCDGEADGYLTVDTSKEGWAMYDSDGNYLGQRGWTKPKRDYKALEFQIDRAWDDHWSFNGSYTLAWSKGNAEGPVNTDTNFGDTGRTENFDDPFVNLNGYGPLANDHRHQFKLRGNYAFNDNWSVGATVDAQSGGPITAFGVGNPFDATAYHSYYICVENCDSDDSTQRVYELQKRGGAGRLPWIVDVGASLSYEHKVGPGVFRAKFAVFNLFDNQKTRYVYQELEPGIGDRDEFFGKERFLQSPRYSQLTLSLDF